MSYNVNTTRLPQSLRNEPQAKLAAFSMLFSLGDVLDWTAEGMHLEIAGVSRPGEADRVHLRISKLSPASGLDEWRHALRVAGDMNRKEPSDGRGGINIFVRPAAGAVPHPWILVDDLPPARATALCQQHAGIAVETSPNNAQCWILLDTHLSHIDRTSIAQTLAARLGGDPGAANGSQFGRLAGFRQRKAGKEGWTNLLADSTCTLQPWPSARLLLLSQGSSPPCPTHVSCAAPPALPSSLSPPTPAPKGGASGGQPRPVETTHGGEHDESAREFAFACHRLRAGWAPERVQAAVAAHAAARGKRRDPQAVQRYAAATVRKAVQAVGART